MANNELKLFLQRTLREYEKDDSLIISTVMDEEGCNEGDGLMSKVLAVEVVGEFGSGKPYSNKVFLKKQPSNAARVELFDTNSLFNNEALLYSEILPLIPECCGIIPRCFFADKDCIVLENLRDQGYIMADKLKGLDLKQSELGMKAIADFHASTYALNLLNEIKFSQIVPNIYDILKDSITISNMLETSLLQGITHLKEINDATITTAIQKLELFKWKMSSTLLKLQTSDVTLLGHGDFWINNMMFRYQNDAVEDIKIIDFQLIKMDSPAADLWKFLYTSLSPDSLNNVCDRLISVYCTHFTEKLRKLKLSKNRQINSDTLRTEIYSKELYGLLMAFIYLPVIYLDFSDKAVDFDKYMSSLDFIKPESSTTPNYSNRLVELLKRGLTRNII